MNRSIIRTSIHFVSFVVALTVMDTGCSKQRLPSDAEITRQLVGAWTFALTNNAKGAAWIATETEYRDDGTLTVVGGVGIQKINYTKPISGSGVWRVEDGCLYTTFTNGVGLSTNKESRDTIISINARSFTYRNATNRTVTAVRKQ